MSTRTHAARLIILLLAAALIVPAVVQAQYLNLPREAMIELTADWQGDRFPDGRPKVPDAILDRMKNVAIEEAWGTIRGSRYNLQFEGDWWNLHPERVMVGRAVTGMFMPLRPDLNNYVNKIGKAQKRSQAGGQNSWVIDELVERDVIVIDMFGKIVDGTFAGGNLANSINAKTGGTGMVVYGGVRDIVQIYDIEGGFNTLVKGADPSAIAGVTLTGLNVPVRIGAATCLPGDVVLATREGVVFIPPHLAERVVNESERITLRDMFGFQRLKEGKYTPGQIDSGWTPEMNTDFKGWLKENIDKLPAPRTTIESMINDEGRR